MDGFSALGAAAAVVQFIDFGSKLVSTSVKVYRSADGAPQELTDLEFVNNHLLKLTGKLQQSSNASGGSGQPNDSNEIRDICRQCTGIATELQGAIKKITGDSKDIERERRLQTLRRTWKSFRQSLDFVWGERKISDLRNRLQVLKQELSLHLLVLLCQQADRNTRDETEVHRLRPWISENSDSGSEATVPDHIGNDFIVNTLIDSPEQWDEWKTQVVGMLSTDEAVGRLSELPPESRESIDSYKSSVDAFFNSLRYPNIMDREVRISAAHEQTLQWVFKDPEPEGFQWTNFTNWLAAESLSENLYWITGKAGSGKSTLIKYIFGEPRTFQSLSRWAQQSPVVTSVFYFWNSGVPMQMSQLGLLQTLLLGILKERPELIPIASRARWEMHRLFGRPIPTWRTAEALEALRIVVDQCAKSEKLCLFIDGLDEFDGDPVELISLVKSFMSPNVKLVTASRPWPAFRDAFGQGPSLVLEHLSLSDIKIFVTNSFDGNVGFKELKSHEPEQANNLATQVTLRSSGVFLWVRIVVQALLSGLTRGDRLSDLQRKLDELPNELELLFGKMIQYPNTNHLRRASELFQIVHTAAEPLPLLVFSFADEEHPEYAVGFQTGALSPQQKLGRCLNMERRLNSYGKGLLEVKLLKATDVQHEARPLKVNDVQKEYTLLKGQTAVDRFVDTICDSRVEYLHRTVKDYLEQPVISAQFAESTNDNFHPCRSLVGAFLIALKCTKPATVTRESFWNMVTWCLVYAHRFELSTGIALESLLDDLDGTGKYLTSTKHNNQFWNSVRQSFGDSIESLHWACTYSSRVTVEPRTFLGLALQCGLHKHGFCKLQKVQHVRELDGQTNDKTFLYCALWGWTQQNAIVLDHVGMRRHPNLELIKALLEKGTNPNLRCRIGEETTFWKELQKVQRLPSTDPDDVRHWAHIIELLLQHGADPNVEISDGIISRIRLRSPESAKKIEAYRHIKKSEARSKSGKAPKLSFLKSVSFFK